MQKSFQGILDADNGRIPLCARGAVRLARGYSLVEVMIGMTILVIVMAGSIAAIPQFRALAYRSDNTADAYEVLNLTLESLRTNTYAQMSDLIGPTPSGLDYLLIALGLKVASANNEDNGISTAVVEADGVEFTVTRKLDYFNNDESIIEATVEVTWRQQSRDYSITGVTLFAENGLSDKKFDLAN